MHLPIHAPFILIFKTLGSKKNNNDSKDSRYTSCIHNNIHQKVERHRRLWRNHIPNQSKSSMWDTKGSRLIPAQKVLRVCTYPFNMKVSNTSWVRAFVSTKSSIAKCSCVFGGAEFCKFCQIKGLGLEFGVEWEVHFGKPLLPQGIWKCCWGTKAEHVKVQAKNRHDESILGFHIWIRPCSG